MVDPVPFVGLEAQARRLRDTIEERLRAVLDHGRYVNGPEVEQLEERLAAYCGAADAVAVASGTDALLMPLLAAGIGPGDAVFVPAFTFTATAEVALLVGATPVFVEVDAATFNLDPEALARSVEGTRRAGALVPRVVIAVDLFGLPADHEAVAAVARSEDLLVIDDAAQAFGAKLGGATLGSVAPITATSFFPAKPLGGYGDGGAIVLRDAELGEALRSVREHGQGRQRYDIVRVGINGRLDTFQAAVLLAKLEVFDEELERRETLARTYDEALGSTVQVPARFDGATSAWAQYTIQVPASERAGFRARLEERGVPTAIYYPRPLHLQPAYAEHGDGEGSLPVSEALCERVVSLPMNPYQSEADTERVCAAVHEAARSFA